MMHVDFDSCQVGPKRHLDAAHIMHQSSSSLLVSWSDWTRKVFLLNQLLFVVWDCLQQLELFPLCSVHCTWRDRLWTFQDPDAVESSESRRKRMEPSNLCTSSHTMYWFRVRKVCLQHGILVSIPRLRVFCGLLKNVTELELWTIHTTYALSQQNSGIPRVLGVENVRVIAECCPQLRRFELYDDHLQTACFDAIATLQQLEHLVLHETGIIAVHIPKLREAVGSMLGKLPGLKVLNIHRNDGPPFLDQCSSSWFGSRLGELRMSVNCTRCRIVSSDWDSISRNRNWLDGTTLLEQARVVAQDLNATLLDQPFVSLRVLSLKFLEGRGIPLPFPYFLNNTFCPVLETLDLDLRSFGQYYVLRTYICVPWHDLSRLSRLHELRLRLYSFDSNADVLGEQPIWPPTLQTLHVDFTDSGMDQLQQLLAEIVACGLARQLTTLSFYVTDNACKSLLSLSFRGSSVVRQQFTCLRDLTFRDRQLNDW